MVSTKKPAIRSARAVENMRMRLFKSHRYRLACHKDAVDAYENWKWQLEDHEQRQKWLHRLRILGYVHNMNPCCHVPGVQRLQLEIKHLRKKVRLYKGKGKYYVRVALRTLFSSTN